MINLPLVHNAKRCDFVIVGGGAVATRKVRTLVKAGANVTVI
ncbi:NAD(P)-dependent oxidoreductase, partial [Thalassolituus sp.]